MWLQTARIYNYKSFRDSGEIAFRPGFNVVVGQNNAGKTALIEALSGRFTYHPTRTREATGEGSASQVTLVYWLEPEQARKRLRNAGTTRIVLLGEGVEPFNFLVFEGEQDSAHLLRQADRLAQTGLQSWNDLIEKGLAVEQQFVASDAMSQAVASTARVQGWEEPSPNHTRIVSIDPTSGMLRLEPLKTGANNSFLDVLTQAAAVYAFKAERPTRPRFNVSTEWRLEPDASNLGQVLHHLHNNHPGRFKYFVERVTRVLPLVRWISTVPVDNPGTIQINVWEAVPSEEGNDLSLPLSESGTGIGHVLAILYVAIVQTEPHVIIIDEPQSYLHPGALRKLFDELREFQQHQYIVTTHSATVIAAANPSAVIRVSKHDGLSTATNIDSTNSQHLWAVLEDLGVSLADVFGFDRVLWVEGKTEATCFKIIVEQLLKKGLYGTAIVGVVNTGDFETGEREKAVEIYTRLTNAGGLIPPAVAFIFDREQRTDDQVRQLERGHDGKMIFLKRRMYENYLLHPGAIGALIHDICPEPAQPCTPDTVAAWLEDRRQEQQYYGKGTREATRSGPDWGSKIHAATVLNISRAGGKDTDTTKCRMAHSSPDGLSSTRRTISRTCVRCSSRSSSRNSCTGSAEIKRSAEQMHIRGSERLGLTCRVGIAQGCYFLLIKLLPRKRMTIGDALMCYSRKCARSSRSNHARRPASTFDTTVPLSAASQCLQRLPHRAHQRPVIAPRAFPVLRPRHADGQRRPKVRVRNSPPSPLRRKPGNSVITHSVPSRVLPSTRPSSPSGQAQASHTSRSQGTGVWPSSV